MLHFLITFLNNKGHRDGSIFLSAQVRPNLSKIGGCRKNGSSTSFCSLIRTWLSESIATFRHKKELPNVYFINGQRHCVVLQFQRPSLIQYMVHSFSKTIKSHKILWLFSPKALLINCWLQQNVKNVNVDVFSTLSILFYVQHYSYGYKMRLQPHKTFTKQVAMLSESRLTLLNDKHVSTYVQPSRVAFICTVFFPKL